MKKYKKISFDAGISIEEAIKKLKMHYATSGEPCFGTFNGVKLYSDWSSEDPVDTAYKKITGKTKAEFDAECKKEHDEYEARKKAHKEAIPELTKEWIEKGREILDEKYMELWEKVVPIRLDDLYEGMELGACLEIVSALQNGCELSEAKEIIENQGHSGMSHGLVCSMVKSFCDRGNEFVTFIRVRKDPNLLK